MFSPSVALESSEKWNLGQSDQTTLKSAQSGWNFLMERVDGIQPDCPSPPPLCGQAGQPGALPAYPQISVYGFIGAAAATRPPVSPHVSPSPSPLPSFSFSPSLPPFPSCPCFSHPCLIHVTLCPSFISSPAPALLQSLSMLPPLLFFPPAPSHVFPFSPFSCPLSLI